MGNAYAKQEKYSEAIDAYNKSLTEHRTPDVLQALQKMEKAKKEKEIQEYINPEISAQEKEKGNEFFKKNLYPEAIKSMYTIVFLFGSRTSLIVFCRLHRSHQT